MNSSLTAALSVLTGVALELGVALRSHRREAWDSEEFWMIGLPCALAACVAIGWKARDRDWRWTAAVVPAQVVTMMARSGDLGFNLWPLTVALSAILSAPFLGAAYFGSRFRRQELQAIHYTLLLNSSEGASPWAVVCFWVV